MFIASHLDLHYTQILKNLISNCFTFKFTLLYWKFNYECTSQKMLNHFYL